MKNSSKYAIALTAALGIFPVALDSTIVNVALVPIGKALNTDFNTIQWIFIGYLLANAAVVSLSGYLGNRFGTKRMFLSGLAIFTVSSVLCSIAPNEAWLIGLRVVQGLGGGMLMPLGMATAMNPFTQKERAKATALIGVPLMLAPVFGPIVGGLLVDNLAWQAIFYVNLPVGLLALWLGWKILPSDEIAKDKNQSNFDYLGMVLSVLGVVSIIYGVKQVSTTNPDTVTATNPHGDIYGWGYWQVWVLLGIGAVLLIAFAINSLRFSKDPVMDMNLFKNYSFTIGNVIVWMCAIIVFGVMSLIPQFLQQVRLPNLSAVDAGLAMMPMGLGTVVGIVLGGGLYSRVGVRVLAMSGAALFAIGFWQMSSLTPSTGGGDIWLWLFFLGMGVTLVQVPAQTLAVGELKGEMLNKASSLINSSKLLFASIGSAILVTILIQQTTSHAEQLRDGIVKQIAAGGAAPTPAQQAQLAAQAGASGMNDLFTILVYGALVLLVAALALPGRNKQPTKTEATEEAEIREPVAI